MRDDTPLQIEFVYLNAKNLMTMTGTEQFVAFAHDHHHNAYKHYKLYFHPSALSFHVHHPANTTTLRSFLSH